MQAKEVFRRHMGSRSSNAKSEALQMILEWPEKSKKHIQEVQVVKDVLEGSRACSAKVEMEAKENTSNKTDNVRSWHSISR